VKWDAGEEVEGAVLGPLGTRTEEDLRGLQKENVAVCMQGDTEITAVFEFAPNPSVQRDITRSSANIVPCDLEEDHALLAEAGFNPEVHEIARWSKTYASPGEIFKLTITTSELACMADTDIDFSWEWGHEGAHIANIQPDSSFEEGSFPNDICYVETKNEYVAWDPPIGVIKVQLSGGERVLKTIIVDYGIVTRRVLSAIVHERANVSVAILERWLQDATNQILLFDEYPLGGNIKDRYLDAMDDHCPTALILGAFGTFCDNDVEMRDALGEYEVIDDPDEYSFFAGSDWALAYGKDILVVGGIQYHPLLGQTADCSTADPKGWQSPLGHVYLSAAGARPAGTLAHELGHYIADLRDMYYCDATQGGCGETPSECTCKCQQFNRARGDHHRRPGGCQCGFQFARLNPGAQNPNNLMSNAAANGAVLLEQKNAFLAAPAKPE